MERRLQKSPLPWWEGMEGRGIKIGSPPPLPCGVKLPAHRTGLPGRVITFYIVGFHPRLQGGAFSRLSRKVLYSTGQALPHQGGGRL